MWKSILHIGMVNSVGVLLAFLFAMTKYLRRSYLRKGGFILVQCSGTVHHGEETTRWQECGPAGQVVEKDECLSSSHCFFLFSSEPQAMPQNCPHLKQTLTT